MKRVIFHCLAIVAALMLSSCGPQAYTMLLQTRQPSKSGLDLRGKTFSVVYLENAGTRDTLLNNRMANGFAKRLEEDYFGGGEVIGIYRMPRKLDGNYSSRDSLQNLIMDTGDDVVFLFDIPTFSDMGVTAPAKLQGTKAPADSAYISKASMPFATTLYIYDSMDKRDTVHRYTGRSTLSNVVYNNGTITPQELTDKAWIAIGDAAEQAGYNAAASFISTWEDQAFSLIYYDDSEWIKAMEYALDFKWDEAIDKWLGLLDTKNLQKRSCAEYNLAVGCFIRGQYDLSEEWLDQSDKDTPISLSNSLRIRLKQTKK